MLRAVNLTCESRVNPLGLDERQPRFSWQLESDERNTFQAGYELRVFRENESSPVWESGRAESEQSLFVPYEGRALLPRTRYFWQVRVWDRNGNESGWSEKAWWETGLMGAAGFEADWITQPHQGDIAKMQPCPMFRREFELTGRVVRARAYASALGIYSLAINGQPAGDAVLAPGYTSYKNRVQYQAYDVTGLLREGGNAVSAVLADGDKLESALRFCLAQQYIGFAAYAEPVADAWLSDVPCEYLSLLAVEELEGYDAFLTALNDQVITSLNVTIPGGLYISSAASLALATGGILPSPPLGKQ